MRARRAVYGVPVRARDRPGGAGHSARPGPGLSDYGRGQDPMPTGNVGVHLYGVFIRNSKTKLPFKNKNCVMLILNVLDGNE